MHYPLSILLNPNFLIKSVNYEDLVELLKKEKSNSALSKVDENIYDEMQSLLDEKEKLSSSGNILFVREYENAKKLVERIKEERMKKIFYFALHSIHPNNATTKELILFNEFKSIIEKFNSSNFLIDRLEETEVKTPLENENKGYKGKDVIEEKPQEIEPKKEEKRDKLKEPEVQKEEKPSVQNPFKEDKPKLPKEEKKKEELEEESEDYEKKIKIIKPVDAYRALDGMVYGPFSAGEIVKINKEEAQWLVESGYAEYV